MGEQHFDRGFPSDYTLGGKCPTKVERFEGKMDPFTVNHYERMFSVLAQRNLPVTDQLTWYQ
jgi:hypothetical protein